MSAMSDRRRQAAYAAALALAIASSADISSGGPARGAQRSTYNPARCKSDAHGKLYIALGRIALALPSTTPLVVQAGLYGGDPPIPAPDPSEPEGCPGNPLQLTGYAVPYADPGTLTGDEKQSADQRPGAEMIQLIKTSRNDKVPTDGDPIEPGENLQLAEQICAHATIREMLPGGLEACRVKPNMDVDRKDWGASYVADPKVYRTPMGRKFTVFCGPLLFRDGVAGCRVGYVLRRGLGLTYTFAPYGRSRALPINHVIEFDRGLRAAIEAVTVKDYRWPSRQVVPDQK